MTGERPKITKDKEKSGVTSEPSSPRSEGSPTPSSPPQSPTSSHASILKLKQALSSFSLHKKSKDAPDDKYLLLQDDKYSYEFKSQLKGRGNGVGGFYTRTPKDVKSEEQKVTVLIKNDPAAICVLEGSAGFVLPCLPAEHKSAINLAKCKTLQDNSGGALVVTVQNVVADATPLDVILLGKKRDPKTPVSPELLHKADIRKRLADLPDRAKIDLAVAMYASSLAGDESQHTAQFMAVKDKEGHVTGIVRIDLGARERYGLKRLEQEDFKVGTSKAYSSSGQMGKEYMEFLQQDPVVKACYMQLCIAKPSIGKVVADAQREFKDALAQIPEGERERLLEDILKIYGKKTAQPGTHMEKAYFGNMDTMIEEILERRISGFHDDALKHVRALAERVLDEDNVESMMLIIGRRSSEFSPAQAARVEGLLESIKEKMASEARNPEALRDCRELLGHMRASVYFSKVAPELRGERLSVLERIDEVSSPTPETPRPTGRERSGGMSPR